MYRKKPDRALILGAGEDVPRKCPPLTPFSFLICADGGAKLARRWHLRPNLLLGDWDSLSTPDFQYWQAQGVPCRKYPQEKDKTDLELAVNHALTLGLSEIVLVGAWGSRIDHSLGNLEVLYSLALQGIKNELLTSQSRLTAVTKEYRSTVKTGSTVSLLPLSGEVRGVYTRGLFYPLAGSTLLKGSTLGISNRAVQETISVQSAQGVLLIVLEQ